MLSFYIYSNPRTQKQLLYSSENIEESVPFVGFVKKNYKPSLKEIFPLVVDILCKTEF